MRRPCGVAGQRSWTTICVEDQVSSSFLNFEVEKIPRSRLSLREREDRAAIGIANVVSGSKLCVTLLVVESSISADPCAAFRTATIPERAALRDHGPVGLSTLRKLLKRRTRVEFGITKCPSHWPRSETYGK